MSKEMEAFAIFAIGFTVGSHLIDWWKNKEIRRVESERDELALKAHKMDLEIKNLKEKINKNQQNEK